MERIEREGHLEPYVEMARELFLDYSGWLERRFGLSLDFQGFEQEMAEFPGVYTPPGGRLIVATVDGEAAGCIASKPKLPATCEMKRLYVRDSFRGRRLGEKLVAALIEEARAAGYRRMVLDTSREMVLGLSRTFPKIVRVKLWTEVSMSLFICSSFFHLPSHPCYTRSQLTARYEVALTL